MKVKKAVITAAGRDQRALPLQTLIDRDGCEKSVLAILIEQVLAAGVEEVCVVVWPGDSQRFAEAAGKHVAATRFVDQPEPRGYGDAICCARDFTRDEPFMHLVADHLPVSSGAEPIGHRLVCLAESEGCAISAVQPTRESFLPHFGVVGGARVAGRPGLYRVDTVLEKPTPTEAEERLVVPGIRAGHYLCFFGMHVLTARVMDLLERLLREAKDGPVSLSAALAELLRHEQYLAMEADGRRFDLGERYGLFAAQLALALKGTDRDLVLTQLVELLAERNGSGENGLAGTDNLRGR